MRTRPYLLLLATLVLLESSPQLFRSAARTIDAWWSPGNGGGTLAFQAPRRTPAAEQPPYSAREFSIYYDFDQPVTGRHATVLSEIADYAEKTEAKRVIVTSLRGATLLSDGSLLTEEAGIAEARAEEITQLLKRAGLVKVEMRTATRHEPEPADGIDDWQTRRTVVRVEP
jgi:hypothetical protein